jgi:hypothetical protein
MLFCVLGAVLASALCSFPTQASEGPASGPAQAMELRDEGYVGSGTCRECHAANHASWQASFHRTMTQAPSSGSVLAPFSGTTPAFEGRAWQLAQEGEAFHATPVGPDGRALGARTRVALLTGSHHFQIYWLATPDGALEQMPLLWHVGEARWVPRRSMFLAPPLPGGSETDRWQQVCIKCHATNGTPIHSSSGATRVAELGIACEACHGPGEAHVAWRREVRPESEEEHGTGVVVPSALEPERASQVCGQCHGIHYQADEAARGAWLREGSDFRPGADLLARGTLLRGRMEQNSAALRAFLARGTVTLEEYFWPDGEVRVSGREYNGLVESPCYQRGTGERRLSCLSCHEMHVAEERLAAGWPADQLRPGMDGPAACLQCHASLGEAEALAAHTHHAGDSSGSDCLNCHMPYTTYGLTKAIRSHTITSPSVGASLATGRPNACNQCHLDRSLGWAAGKLHEWYGQERPQLEADQAKIAASVLWALSGDAGQRALMAWSLGWAPARAVSGTGWMPYLLSTLLLDEYDAVRWIALGTARLEPRWRELSLDLFQELEAQRNHVRATALSEWLAAGLSARADQREAVLVLPDGKLDEPRFRAIYARRDNRPVTLSE